MATKIVKSRCGRSISFPYSASTDELCNLHLGVAVWRGGFFVCSEKGRRGSRGERGAFYKYTRPTEPCHAQMASCSPYKFFLLFYSMTSKVPWDSQQPMFVALYLLNNSPIISMKIMLGILVIYTKMSSENHTCYVL